MMKTQAFDAETLAILESMVGEGAYADIQQAARVAAHLLKRCNQASTPTLSLLQGLAEADAGAVVPAEEVFAELRARQAARSVAAE